MTTSGTGRDEQAGGDVAGDVVAVGPTGDTRATTETEPGPARTGTAADTGAEEAAGVGHSGDPIAVDPQRLSTSSEAGAEGTRGPTAGAATSAAGVAGFGADTGLGSDDPASGVLTGDPGARATGAGGSTVGQGGQTGGAWTDEPGARSETTEAVTDPVGEDWSADPGTGTATDRTGERGQQWADEAATTTGTGTGGAYAATGSEGDTGLRDNPTRSEPSTLATADAPGTPDGIGGALDPLDPRTGTADDPNNPQQPSV
jgi:hypothetical protein